MGLISSLYGKLSGAGKATPVAGTIYDFRIRDIEGNEVDFNQYKGRNLLIVNTASKCGYTPQYEDLEKLHREHGDKVTVLGFPANNFLWQEPGTELEIASFCQRNYGVTFKMFSKISVKGKDSHPLYQWLRWNTGKLPSWNFCKYFVNKDASEIKFFPSDVKPMDAEIVNEVVK